MSVADLFTKQMWETVASQLPELGLRWWSEHRDAIIDVGKEEMEDILRALESGDTAAAKIEVASHMSRAEWKHYRDGTTNELRGIAIRRAKLMAALSQLGVQTARLIGTVAKTALGL